MDAIEARLARIEEKLDAVLASMEQNAWDSASDWAISLIREVNTGTDTDGNSMILGRHFMLAENMEHIPPVLQALLASVDNQSAKRLSWEQYAETLPMGKHRESVEKFISALPSRHVRPDGERDAAQES